MQQAVDHSSHRVGGLDYDAQLLDQSVIQAARIFERHQSKTVDVPQRRAQVVGDRIGKRLQLAMGRFQLCGELGDAPRRAQQRIFVQVSYHFQVVDPSKAVMSSNGSGLLKRYPCSWSHPSRSSALACSSASTPSATTLSRSE